MDAATLARAMGCSQSTADAYVDDVNTALLAAGCTTVNRAAMYCAQVGHESAGLRYMEELASGAAYEGRRDLGNTEPGDGRRFKGRGPIQLTGRHNYGLFSAWAEAQGLVDDADHFVRNPALVATPQWGFLAASWYWTVARPNLNAQADAGDIVAATRSINGGTNGLDDRRARWNRCRGLGDALLPTGGPAPVDTEEDDLTPEQDQMLRAIYAWLPEQNRKTHELYMQLVQGTGGSDPKTWGWRGWAGGTGETLTVVDRLRRLDVEVRQLRNAVAKLAGK